MQEGNSRHDEFVNMCAEVYGLEIIYVNEDWQRDKYHLYDYTIYHNYVRDEYFLCYNGDVKQSPVYWPTKWNRLDGPVSKISENKKHKTDLKRMLLYLQRCH